MNKSAIVFAALLCIPLAGHAVASHASEGRALIQALRAPLPVRTMGQPPIAIPANTLTGRGAIATPDGVAHF